MNPASEQSKRTPQKAPKNRFDDLDILDCSVPMDSEAYIQGLASLMKAATKDLQELDERKRKLLVALAKTNEEIAAKKDRIAKISELWKLTPFADKPIGETKPLLKETSFTKAIMYVLSTSTESLSPTEIRTRLSDWGFNLAAYQSDVVASIHTTLKRLEKSGRVRSHQDGPRRTLWEAVKGQSGQESLELNTRTA